MKSTSKNFRMDQLTLNLLDAIGEETKKDNSKITRSAIYHFAKLRLPKEVMDKIISESLKDDLEK